MSESTQIKSDFIGQLFARINYEQQARLSPGDFKLSNMIRLLERLGNPQLNYPVVHVAGTKGKGSVCAMIGSILSHRTESGKCDPAADVPGQKVGVYSSPHLDRINQRILIGGQEISDELLNDILGNFDPIIRKFDQTAQKSRTKQLTFFEVITAVAFQAFSDAGVDVAVLEVGMGGRLDSTNVCQPAVCVITNISLDHTRQLGSTVDKIAAEKAGIIKNSVPVVNGAIGPETKTVIEAVAAERECQIFHLHRDFAFQPDAQSPGQFSYQSHFNNTNFQLSNLYVGMRGRHQYENAALAIAACQQLSLATFNSISADSASLNQPQIGQQWGPQSKVVVRETAIRQGLAATTLPGRCEVFGSHPMVVLDIAHNVASTAALAATLTSDMPDFQSANERILIFAASREKDVAGMVETLVNLFDRIVVTQYQDNPRGRPAMDVFKIVSRLCRKTAHLIDVSIAESPTAAWQQFMDSRDPCRAICITGSAFLVAELRPAVVQWSNNRC